MIGKRFNKWTVIEFHSKMKSGNSLYRCVCDCGKEGVVKDSNLRHGGSTQCKTCSGKQNGKKGIYAQNQGSDLYIIRCLQYVKIGTTKDLTERLRTIKSGNPFPLEVLYYGVNEGMSEQYWHDVFKHKHHSGEWYLLDLCDVDRIKRGCEI